LAAESRKQGFLWRFALGPRAVRILLNVWGPFRGAGIHVREIAPDFRRVTVELRMRLMNRNYVGTHFGGSLFAMTDPFFMVMMMHNLGPDYIVWDKSGAIRFLKPAKGTVTARLELTEAMVNEARAQTQSGAKFEPTYRVEVTDAAGVAVAAVEKTLYIRKK
jgi:acyl-coenzyme A thioesterase PaaI-like protein